MCTLYYQFDSFCCMKQGLSEESITGPVPASPMCCKPQHVGTHHKTSDVWVRQFCTKKKGGDHPGLKNNSWEDNGWRKIKAD